MKTIGIAAIATLICLVSFSATAAVRDVNNVNDPINHPYREYVLQNNCTVQGDCALTFSATTASETLIAHVSCVYILASGGTTLYAVLANPGNNDANFLPVNAYASNGGAAYRSMNESTYLFFQNGQTPRIDVFSNGAPVQDLQCTISGYHN